MIKKTLGTLCVLTMTGVLPVMANAGTDNDERYRSTFGFESQDVMTEKEKIEMAYKDREKRAQYLLDSDKNIRAGQKKREIKQQESLIFIAKQQLNGRTPVYGKEKEDLEKIIKNAQEKIAQLEKEEKSIRDAKGNVELVKDMLKDSYPEIDRYEAMQRGESVQEDSFFNYGSLDSNSKTVGNGRNDSSKVRSQDALNAVDGVINKMTRDGDLSTDAGGDKYVR